MSKEECLRALLFARFHILPQRRGSDEKERLQQRHRTLCTGTWAGDFDHSRFPGRGVDVFGGFSADRLRYLLFETVKGGAGVKIVVWRAPRLLRGILGRLWGKRT